MDENITAAPTPLVLGGTQYLMSPLTDRDIAQLDEWIRTRLLQTVRQSLKDQDVDDDDYEREMRIAQKSALSLTWLSGEGAKILGTVDGMSRLVLQSVGRNHPELDLESIRKMLLDPSNMNEVNDAFRRVNDLNNSDDGDNKTPAKKSSKKSRSNLRKKSKRKSRKR